MPKNRLSITDNFFKLGGDSISSIQLVSRLRQRLGLYINVKDIFNFKNIERLYDHVISKTFSGNTNANIKTEQGILIG